MLTSQTRHLSTRPRLIPTYIKPWDPTLHSPFRPPQAPNELPEPDEPPRNTIEQGPLEGTRDDSHQLTEKQHSTKGIVIKFNGRNSRITHDTKRLQYILNLAICKDDSNSTLRAPLWNAYILAMRRKVLLPRHLPRRAWNILWKSQYADFSNPSRRQAHLAKLDRDLLAAQAPPIAGQVAYRIERKFMAGMQEQALDMWESSRHDFATAPEYLDTGARLYALAGHPDQARNIMDHLLQLERNWDLTVMKLVFRAYTSSDLKQHHNAAKDIYHVIKARMGTKGILETYDSCFIGFLEAKSLPGAKQVFRDMVREGYLKTEGSESHVQEVLRRLNLLYALGTTMSSMTSIALDAITVLPVAYHGHVFGDWMKSAVVQKAPQAAAQILDMMIRRGYQPEATHFNLLLRSLFGKKEREDTLKAEDIGWKMIEEARLSSIRTERHPQGSRLKGIADNLQNVSVLDANSTIPVPAASTSTFALIMRHHAQSSQWEHVDYLTRQLKLANVATNTPIMNVLIESKGHQGRFVEAWQIYKSLTNEPDPAVAIFPDGQTIRILWRTLRFALSDPANRDNPNLPTPRELLHETIKWWMLVRQRYDAERFLQGLAAESKGAITSLMLHCFSYIQDLAGSLAALHVLRQKFDIHPTRDAAMTVVRQLAWEAMHDETESVRTQFGLSKNRARNIQRLSRTYQHLYSRRIHRLEITEDILQTYSKEEKGDLELNVISEFVRVVLLANYPPEIVELLIEDATSSVGVPRMPTGDVTALDLITPLSD